MTSPLPLPHGHGDAASDRFTKQLGRIVLASTHLEATCADLARALGIDPSADTLQTLVVVERRVAGGIPPWASVRCEDLTRWSEYARHLIDDRDRLFAALPTHRFTGSEGDAPRITSSDGSVVPADERYLDRMIGRMHRHDTIGVDLRLRLEFVDAKGASWPIGRWHLEVVGGVLGDPAIPERLAQLPDDWQQWLRADPAAPAA